MKLLIVETSALTRPDEPVDFLNLSAIDPTMKPCAFPSGVSIARTINCFTLVYSNAKAGADMVMNAITARELKVLMTYLW
jgi:hypothetical protein